jgi:Choline/Carnitine o-acyltransferase
LCPDVQLTDELKSAVEAARAKFHASTSKLDVNYLQYQKFGKDYIKTKKLSPDSFMQLAFQVA